MSKRYATAFATTLALALTLAAPHGTAKDGGKGGHAVLLPAGEIKWADVPGFTGVQMAALGGNPAKGRTPSPPPRSSCAGAGPKAWRRQATRNAHQPPRR